MRRYGLTNQGEDKWAWLVAVLLAGSTLAYGQAATYARLVGTVKDQTGAVLPGVEVTATA